MPNRGLLSGLARPPQPLAPLFDDPLGLGFVTTFATGVVGAPATWSAANASHYARCINGGEINAVAFAVGVQSGNVSVGAFSNRAAGRLATPDLAMALSGAVACPAPGYAAVSLNGPIRVRPGDWLAMSVDNNAMSCYETSNAASPLYSGVAYAGSTEYPLPSQPGTLTASTSRHPLLIGVLL